ncbi:MAG: DMT family transporter [Eubacteriales bacterium]|nr:DMT family transporter [Eubacteriales bacterium]
MQTKKTLGNLLLLMTAVIWGLAFTAQKIAGDRIPPFALNGIRFLLGALVLIPALFVLDRTRGNGRVFLSPKNPHFIDLTKRELLGGIACGAALLAATIFQQFGLLKASPGKASFLTALYMVFVPLWGLARRKVARPTVWVSVIIALCGAYLLTGGDSGGAFVSGDLLLFASAALFGLHITLVDVFSSGTDGVRLSFVQFAVAGVFAIPGALIHGAVSQISFAWADLFAVIPHLLYLGIGSCGIGYTSQIVGQQLSGTPTVASLIMSLESVFGLLGGVLILGDQPTSRQIAGCAVILFAVIFSQLPLGDWLARVRHRPIHAAGENTPGNMVSGTAADSPVTTDAPSPDTAPATDAEPSDGGDTGADK